MGRFRVQTNILTLTMFKCSRSCKSTYILLATALQMASNQQQNRFYVAHRNEAASISHVEVSSCESSNFLKPLRLNYKQKGTRKTWDYLKVHDSVATLLFNTERDVFILVRQFRPAVYASVCSAYTVGQTIDTLQYPGQTGMTYELCAGIIDKNIGVRETAREEILEETGYDVPLENIKEMMNVRNSVGVTGSKQALFYADVTDAMKSTIGGGNPQEGETVEVIELPLKEANDFLFDEQYEKPSGMIAAFLWYFREKGMFTR